MPQALLWVQKTSGTESSASTSQEGARIRRHVQENRRKESGQPLAGSTSACRKRPRSPSLEYITGMLASALRPNKSLGRLASKPVISSRSGMRKTTMIRGKKEASLNSAIPVKSLPWHLRFLSATERRSLSFFQLRTSKEWSGWADTRFWNNLALQMSHRSRAVAHSLIVLSTIHESLETTCDIDRKRLQLLSYEQSNKAIGALLTTSNISYFEALVSCLIIVCFHGIQQTQASFVLLRSGMRLLDERYGRGQMCREERKIAEIQLRPLFNRLKSKHCSMVDPCRAFALSVEQHRATESTRIEEEPIVPALFSSVSEARHWLQQILDWAHDDFPSRARATSSLEIFLVSFRRLTGTWQRALAQYEVSSYAEVSRSLNIIKAASIVSAIIVEMAYYAEETSFDKHLAAFEETVTLVERAGMSGHSFGIDAGLLEIVAFVGVKCRDPQIRRRALTLLKSRVRLEGDRIASNPAAILEVLITLEERGLEVTSCFDVPESSRRFLLCGQQHIEQGRIDLFYASGDGSIRENCSVPLRCSAIQESGKKADLEASFPRTIFGLGYVAYLEDRQTRDYTYLKLDRFFFSVPRV